MRRGLTLTFFRDPSRLTMAAAQVLAVTHIKQLAKKLLDLGSGSGMPYANV